MQQEQEKTEVLESTDGVAVPEELTKSYYFGFGGFHPKWLQVLANRKVFAFLTCCVAVLQLGLVQGFVPVIISSLETRYNFGSTEAGALLALFDAVVAVSVIFISYFGGKSHKPRFIGIFIIIIGIGGLVFASPQFLFGSYSPNRGAGPNSTHNLCINDTTSSENEGCLSINVGAYTVLVIGVILTGIGSAPIYTIIPAYIDEIVHPRYVSLYLSVFLLFGVIGPAIGFGVGSAFLSINVDPWFSTDRTPDDPTWVGAWWIGHVIFSILLLILSVPYLMFPRYLPDSLLVRKERAKEMAKVYSSKYVNEDSLVIIVKTFPIHIKQLLLNPSFMLMSFGLAVAFIVKDGIIGFGPKYVETIFSLTATTSGLLAGGVAIVGAGMGLMVGGMIIFVCKLKSRHAAAIAWIVLLIATPASFLYFVRCPSPQVAGILVPYADGSQSGEDSSVCAMSCNCMSALYEPVCGEDGLSYFSSCRAGCTTRLQNEGGDFVYANCSCIMESFTNTSSVMSSTAVNGACTDSCYNLWIFIVCIGALVFLLLMIEIPYYYATLRVVADEQRPLALGVQSFIYRVFGSIPGPLLFGVVFDASCASFNYECGKRGNCWIYDNATLSLNAFILTIPCCIISAFLLFLHWILYPKRKVDDAEGDKTEMTVFTNGDS